MRITTRAPGRRVPTTIARLSVPYGDAGGWPWYHLMMMKAGVQIPVHRDAPNVYNPLHERDCLAKIPGLLAAATPEVTTVNFGGSQAVSIEEWCAELSGLTGLEPVFEETQRTVAALPVDLTRMHEIAGPTKVGWREGMRRMVEARAPEMLRRR